MKKLFTLLLAVATGVGTLFAENVQIGDLYYNLDATNQTAEVFATSMTIGLIQVNDNSIADWNTLPAQYVAQATCPDDAIMDALKSAKVYADQVYINILVEYDPDQITDRAWPAFHVYLDTDNSNATGGYGDQFLDPNTDVVLETAVFASGEPYDYNPAVFKWWGEVGGSGWCWTEHWEEEGYYTDGDGLNWGAIIGEGQSQIGHSQIIDDKYIEIQLLRELIPSPDAPWNATQFGIGFDILQNWSSVGVLPCASPTNDNPNGKAAKLQVTIDNTPYAEISGDIVIPETVNYDGVTYSVTSIGGSAFYGCNGLTSVTIPNSVTSIGLFAFYGCSGLTSVIWNAKNCADFASNNTPFYADYYDEERYQYIQFDLRPQITSFTFGNEVEHIPAYLCNGMSNLTSVNIPNSVTSIGSYAFERCSGLTSVTTPNSVTSIGKEAFSYCSSLTSLVVQNPNLQIEGECYYSFANSTALKYISAPACIFDIHSDYTSYPSYFPQKLDSIKVIGGELSENALWVINLSRKTLRSVDLSGTAHTELADEAFKEFYNLRKLILPANLTYIGYKSVAECVKLQSIDIPASVEEIDDRAFEDCRSIQTITFGGAPAGAPGRFNAPMAASQLRRIGNWAFYNAHELQSLVIPEGVTEIGDGAFYGCTYLEDLTLPKSVQSIGDNCFALCSKLTQITCAATTPPAIQAKTFYDVKRQIPVYVPADAVSAYESDPYWQEFDIQGQQAPQGVDEVQSDQVQSTKVVRDGKMYILRGEKIYTVTGQLVY